MIVIVSASLNADSNSRILAQEAQRVLEQEGHTAVLLDLREHPLPLCDGNTTYTHPAVEAVGRVMRAAQAIIVATPIYNYDANAAVKNLIELTGDAWKNKPVGFLCAASGVSGYMSILPLANSLMLNFRSLIVPRFVYATGRAFAEGRIIDAEITRRVGELARATAQLTQALQAA